MNFVYLSPHFPPNYYRFCVGLREEGVNVLGLADAPYESLRPELRGALTEYYRVDDMDSYDALVRALGHFTHRYGKLDGIDSLSEHWLETEARLRTDFNMEGLRQDRIGIVKRKSSMKEIYRAAGIRVARGAVVRTVDEARRLIAETGYPVVAKPDVGVGAAATFKIGDDGELSSFFDRKTPADYIVEEFIRGRIVSFDGLADRDGNLVFFTSHAFSQGIMETVNEDADLFYHSLREIPADLEEAGRRTARAFDVRGRFFHLEFFRADRDGGIVALEVNLRPPGGLTTDMFNYANDFDIVPGVGAGDGPQPVHGGLVPSLPCRLRRPEAGEAIPSRPRGDPCGLRGPHRAPRGDRLHLPRGDRRPRVPGPVEGPRRGAGRRPVHPGNRVARDGRELHGRRVPQVVEPEPRPGDGAQGRTATRGSP